MLEILNVLHEEKVAFFEPSGAVYRVGLKIGKMISDPILLVGQGEVESSRKHFRLAISHHDDLAPLSALCARTEWFERLEFALAEAALREASKDKGTRAGEDCRSLNKETSPRRAPQPRKRKESSVSCESMSARDACGAKTATRSSARLGEKRA